LLRALLEVTVEMGPLKKLLIAMFSVILILGAIAAALLASHDRTAIRTTAAASPSPVLILTEAPPTPTSAVPTTKSIPLNSRHYTVAEFTDDVIASGSTLVSDTCADVHDIGYNKHLNWFTKAVGTHFRGFTWKELIDEFLTRCTPTAIARRVDKWIRQGLITVSAFCDPLGTYGYDLALQVWTMSYGADTVPPAKKVFDEVITRCRSH
jgi:hypothetical protein